MGAPVQPWSKRQPEWVRDLISAHGLSVLMAAAKETQIYTTRSRIISDPDLARLTAACKRIKAERAKLKAEMGAMGFAPAAVLPARAPINRLMAPAIEPALSLRAAEPVDAPTTSPPPKRVGAPKAAAPIVYAQARAEVLAAAAADDPDAAPVDYFAALAVIARLKAVNAAQTRHAAWACGRRADGATCAPGLNATLTDLLRRFAACGVVYHRDVGELHRHVCALRKRLPAAIVIETVTGQGYEITAGFDHVLRLLHLGAQPSLRIEGFTVKETAILKVLAQRGEIAHEAMTCVQRHMSNIRRKLAAQGHDAIALKTDPAIGYVVVKGRKALQALASGRGEDVETARAA